MTRPTFADHGIELPHGRSGEVDTTCPQCSPTRRKSRDKCLSVNTEKGIWVCHHCGWSGSLGRASNAPPLSSPPLQSPRRVYRKPAPLPPSSAPDQWMLDWFAKRGITPEVVAANRISAGMAFSPIEGKPVRAIHFPYFRDGEHINTKHRGPGKTFWMERGAERILYGLDKIGESKAAVLVEGEMDALSIEVAGGPPALSVPDGAPAPDAKNYAAKFAFLESAEAKLADLRQILIATDMDAPGRKLAEELARRLGPERCLRVDWPEGCKDANDTLVRHGVEGARAALDAARPYPRSAALADPTLGVTNSARRQIHVVPPVRGRRVIIDLPHHEVSDAR